jgi:hypothetical protein
MSRVFPSPAVWASLDVPQVTATVRQPDERLWEIYAKPIGTLTDEDVAYLNYVELEAGE